MDISQRIAIYKEIEEYRQKPLIVYATSTRGGVNSMMASDAVRPLIDQIDKIPDKNAVDVLIHSSGGDSLTAWKLMSILREQFEEVNVLVPFMAFSAATIFALGADQIIMHPHASLGPIDPQITVHHEGKQRQFAYEDVGAFLRFLKEEIGITEQAYTSPLIDKLFSAVDPIFIGAAKRASELSTSVGERLLKMHLSSDDEENSARQIAENLNKSFFAHGDAVSRARARNLNLKIANDNLELEQLMWKAYLGIEEYLQLNEPFNPLTHFLSDPEGEKVLEPTAPLIMPPNSPPELLEQMWNQVANQSLSNALNKSATQVDYLLIHAIIESAREATECFTEGRIFATRVVGGDISLSSYDTGSGWRNCPLSQTQEQGNEQAE